MNIIEFDSYTWPKPQGSVAITSRQPRGKKARYEGRLFRRWIKRVSLNHRIRLMLDRG